MKKILSILLFIGAFFPSQATHTKGGWMYYEYLGPGINNPTHLRYRVGINYYIECSSTIIDSSLNFSVFSASSPFSFVEDIPVAVGTNNQSQNCNLPGCYPCISNIPTICYTILNYETIIELAPNAAGYILSKQRCCRINNISNMLAPSNVSGVTYTISIPGVNAPIANAHINSSPRFNFNDTTIVCADNPFFVSFAATDTDGDSLVYSFCNSYTGASQSVPDPATSSPPPFFPVPYELPFSGAQPLGPGVNINPVTGVVSGTAPPSGEYVVTICVAEYRNGVRFADSRKELHLKVTPCTPVIATLDPTFLTCGDLTLAFQNNSDGPSIQSWFWTFGDPTTGSSDTSILQFPSHTFSAAGVYSVKLVVNKGLSCSDSSSQIVSVYPGFFSGFSSIAPSCEDVPIQFIDTSRTNHGVVNQWFWNFGVTTTLADSSRSQNPTFTFSNPGTYIVKLISGNSLGCKDSISIPVVISPRPALVLLTPDSTYCGLDSVQLTATGTGNFTWTPGTNIIGANTGAPTVFPTVPTTYTVTLENMGCRSTDTVRLNPSFNLSNNISAFPASICQDDTLRLTGGSNKTSNVRWLWGPAASVATATASTTLAFPQVSTNYTLQTRWGNNCVVSKTINIPVKPLATPGAGADVDFCRGQAAVQLVASGGQTYNWSPTAGLSSTTIPNPLASPATTTSYVVAVGVTGCAKKRTDTVVVTVRQKPIINITNDTLICVTDTLRLNVTGQGSILWSPNYMIDNIGSFSPLVSPDVPTTYRMRYTDLFGCFQDDTVRVDVKAQVTLDAGMDTALCFADGYRLRTTGDAVSYTWIPTLYLNNSQIKNPFSLPDTSITYTVIGNIGKCQAQSEVTIKVIPPPTAFAGRDATICFGETVQLFASGGTSYSWTPANFLSDKNIANPFAQKPRGTMTYIVTVTDTLGCPKAINDTIIVKVIPPLRVNAGPSDTSIVDGQPLFLRGTGALNYTWSPRTWLSNASIANPVATPPDSIQYILTGTDINGCVGTDSINVTVFTIEPSMYVPTAFTPNGDGRNDVIRPVLIGMKSLTYFRVYNRFGELVYITSKFEEGWNGVFKGKPQDTATFVWVAQGITYKGDVINKKGHVVLIR